MSRLPTYGCVVLTQGRRPTELHAALESVLVQSGVGLDVVVVGNGWAPQGLPESVRPVPLPHNVGIPAGRNAGAAHVGGELLLFLDDDARLGSADMLARIAERFAAEPPLGLLQPRVEDLAGGPPPRRWVPRLRVGDRRRSSDVTAVWEGAVVLRREVFEQVEGWAGGFFYAHEGIDLAWAVWDAGFRVFYDADVVALHPVVAPARHAELHRLSARNRVWLARRRLPVVLAVPYLFSWTVLTLLRTRGRQARREALRGAVAGLREDPGQRRPMSWRTAWRMTRAGRPPVV